jgi:tRNA pseudouridine32 synthase/23S rRNA pseudouridine746 synthase
LTDRGAPLPSRDGVGPACVTLPIGPWKTTLDFLTERFPHVSRPEFEARLARGDMVYEDGTPAAAAQSYTPRRKLYYYRAIAEERRIPFEARILYQDEYLVAVDKPHFLPVTPGGHYLQETLLVRLVRLLGIETLAPMHRLDRETAGVVLFTVKPALRGRYQDLFKDRAVEKEYEAIAPHQPMLELPLTRVNRLVRGEPFFRMREARNDEPGESNAQTTIERLEVLDENWARYRLTPLTGKKHQLRVHMAGLGIPIRNDMIYPKLCAYVAADESTYDTPLQLLARRIAFTDPVTGKRRQFSSKRSLLDTGLQR